MWQVNAQNITMTEGDFGIQQPVTIRGTTFAADDYIKITFKNRLNGTMMLEKDFTNIQNGTVNLELTEAESALFPVGTYVYSLDWYQSGSFMCNIIREATFKVVDKA